MAIIDVWIDESTLDSVPVPSERERQEQHIGQYQGITLELATGRLYYDPIDWRRWVASRGQVFARTDMVPMTSWLPPETGSVRWHMDSGVYTDKANTSPSPWPYVDTEDMRQLLKELRPHVQQMLTAMDEVPGVPGLYDWSSLSAEIAVAISRRLDRTQQQIPPSVFPGEGVQDMSYLMSSVPEFAEYMRRVESLDKPRLLSRERIRLLAEQLGRGFSDPLAESLGIVPEMGELRILGATRYLHQVRQQAAGEATVVDAEDWFSQRQLPESFTDAQHHEVAELAAEYDAQVLDEHGVYLVGTESWIHQHQPELRERVRAQLTEEGMEALRLADAAKRVARRRNAALARVLSWGERGDTDSALARQACVSHTTVSRIRAALAISDDEDRDEEREDSAELA